MAKQSLVKLHDLDFGAAGQDLAGKLVQFQILTRQFRKGALRVRKRAVSRGACRVQKSLVNLALMVRHSWSRNWHGQATLNLRIAVSHASGLRPLRVVLVMHHEAIT